MQKKHKNSKLSRNRFSHLTFLKTKKTEYFKSPEDVKLEVFENVFSDRDYEITFECPEYTSLCPVTNQPDFGEITIKYIPDKTCIESKSLKLYLFSFRNYNTFHEESVNLILDAIVKACSPRWAEVTGNFRTRGGISIKVKVSTDSVKS